MADRETIEAIRDLRDEVREELRITREAYGEQLELTRVVVNRNGEAFLALVDELGRFRASSDALGERLEDFRGALELQREILVRFLERLDEEEPPRG